MKSRQGNGKKTFGIDFICLLMGVGIFFVVNKFLQSMQDREHDRMQKIAEIVSLNLEDSKGNFPVMKDNADAQRQLTEVSNRHQKPVPKLDDLIWNTALNGKHLAKLEDAKHTWCLYFRHDYDIYLGFADGKIERMTGQTSKGILKEVSE